MYFFYLKGNILTESDIRILNIVLAEHLSKLKENDFNLNQDEHITKEEVVLHLEKIDQYEFAKILSENKGKAFKYQNTIACN